MKGNELYKKRRLLMLRKALFILSIGMFIMIFAFSSQNAEQSSYLSKEVITGVIDNYPKTMSLSNENKQVLINNYHEKIRETAHYTEYAILAIFVTAFISTFNLKWQNRVLVVLGTGILYALLDEIHQIYTGGGRAFELFDICIDSLGVCTGLIIVFCISLVYKFILNKQKLKQEKCV